MTNRSFFLYAVLLFVLLPTSCRDTPNDNAAKSTPQHEDTETSPVQAPIVVEDKIHSAIQYLLTNLDPNGRFQYQQYSHGFAVEDTESYNVLRHAGTVYALGQYAELYPDVNIAAEMVRAGTYLRACCLLPLELGSPDNKAFWSRKEIVGGDRAPRAKLGGIGLGLLAFLAVERQQPGFTTQTELSSIANAILAMQQSDGRFQSIYLGATEGFDETFESLYYPGEAILALLQMYRFDQDERWVVAGLNALRYICHLRENMPLVDIPNDHWILLATRELFQYVDPRLYQADRHLFVRHAERIVQVMLSRQYLGNSRHVYYGSFNRQGNTNSAGTRLEGIIAIGPHLTDAALADQAKIACHAALQYLQTAIVTEGDLKGGITYLPQAVIDSKPVKEKKDHLIQIDNVQHVASAWMWSIRNADWLYDQ